MKDSKLGAWAMLIAICVAAVGCTPKNSPEEQNDTDTTTTRIAGAFSVSADKQVYFAHGNLRYVLNNKTWHFAENQYDMIGESNIVKTSYADTIDLFGWSGSMSKDNTKWGISLSTDSSVISKNAFVDWGTNAIGTDTANTWRTLTLKEWYWLRYERRNAASLIGIGSIQLNDSVSVNGLFLLPDSWTPTDSISLQSGFASTYSIKDYAEYQTITLQDWERLDSAGVVFLPAAGGRKGANVEDVQKFGHYWSATVVPSSAQAGYFYFGSQDAFTSDGAYCFYGRAVRLVRDAKEQEAQVTE